MYIIITTSIRNRNDSCKWSAERERSALSAVESARWFSFQNQGKEEEEEEEEICIEERRSERKIATQREVCVNWD